jgi:hypothetical protein
MQIKKVNKILRAENKNSFRGKRNKHFLGEEIKMRFHGPNRPKYMSYT